MHGNLMVSNDIIRHYIDSLKGLVDIDVVYGGRDDVLLRGTMVSAFGNPGLEILNRIAHLPGRSDIVSVDPKIVIRVQPPGKVRVKKIPWLNIILFFLTLFSTIIVGAGYAGGDFAANPSILWTDPLRVIYEGMPFSFSLLGILLFHEFGHYIASRRHGVKVTLPYFLPFPNIIGTMGAVIRIKSPFITRKQLLDVGAAGPLAGMMIAIPVVIWGLAHPVYIPETTELSNLYYLGDSLLFSLINILVQPPVPAGYISLLHPVAFAGWVGFLVTMLNLLPIGQLDGGHVLYAMFGKAQHRIAYFALIVLALLSLIWAGWIIWAFLGFVLVKAKHPPTVLDDIKLDKKRMAIGYICMIIFLLCFIPVPFADL